MFNDKSIPPKSLSDKIKIDIKRPLYFRMKNGLKVILEENHKLPLVKIDLELDSTSFLEKDKVGLQMIFGKMLRSGTKNYTKEKLDNIIDHMGISLYTSFNEISVSTLRKYLDPSISIIVDILMNCNFTNYKELEKIIKQKVLDIDNSEKNPNVVLGRVKNVLFFGKEHPYGEYETIDTIHRITLKDLKKIYKKYYIPNRFYLSFVGDISKEEVKYICKHYFSKWKRRSFVDKYFLTKDHYFPNKKEINIVDIPTLTQSSICLGYPIDLRRNDPIYIPAILANGILGDGPYSRLFMNIREKKAYTYGIHSTLKSDKNGGYFSIYTQVRNEVTDKVIRDILKEMYNFISSKISLEELNIKKNEIIGQFLLDLEDPRKIVDLFICEKKENLSYKFHDNFLKNLQKVTVKDIDDKRCKKFFNPKNIKILIVGKANDILPSIKKLGFPIRFFDSFGRLIKRNV